MSQYHFQAFLNTEWHAMAELEPKMWTETFIKFRMFLSACKLGVHLAVWRKPWWLFQEDWDNSEPCQKTLYLQGE